MQKVWNGEPAVYKGLIGTLVTIFLAYLDGKVTASDGLLNGLINVATVLVPILTGASIRPSVTPVLKSNDLG